MEAPVQDGCHFFFASIFQVLSQAVKHALFFSCDLSLKQGRIACHMPDLFPKGFGFWSWPKMVRI
ncbi:MAG: hypothetical protein MI784_05835 [Cytophagales bacterium]|nr:hypothetical protein [Cytophagales bacterium]